ncbi:MAG: Eco47II family restriction endonuclease [Saprospiraceae bacterium]
MNNNSYLDFVSDKHLIDCIALLHKAYVKAKSDITTRKFYANKVDTFKMIFDAKFNAMEGEDLIKMEILRQIDKSVNNSIGTFHEQVLGGIPGYETGNLSGYDIKASDNTLFADIKNKHNTMNSSSAEALFQKLKRFADDHKKAKCYWVQVLAKDSFCEEWTGEINGKEYRHSRVYKISGDKFYALITGQNDALFQLYKALPRAIDDYLKSNNQQVADEGSVAQEIAAQSRKSKRSIIDQITFENYSYYTGFGKL